MKEVKHGKDDLLKWLCAFANAEGGTLMVGYNDQGDAVGIDQAVKLLEDIPNKVRDVLGIVVDVNPVQHGHLQTLHIKVPAYPYPVSYKGEYHYRSGSTKQELKGAALDRFLLRKQGLHWDSVPLPHVQTNQLQEQTLKNFRQQAVHSQRLPETALTESTELLLERLRLTHAPYLKRAAVLLFHPEPDRFVTGAAIKIGAFGQSNADLLHHDEITGNLFTQATAAVEVLKLKYLKARISYDGLYRKERYPLPMAALREAILNAIVHKDYASHIAIQISVYQDKLMIWNPGQLPADWTLEKLMAKHASHPFNPDIANAFFRAGLIESWGRGIERITEACEEDGYPTPVWALEPGGLWVTFAYSPDQADQVTDQVTEEIHALLQVMQGEMTRADIQTRLGLRHTPHVRSAYLQPALTAGWVEMTLPDKPTSRLQKYRLTAAGKRLQAELQSGQGGQHARKGNAP